MAISANGNGGPAFTYLFCVVGCGTLAVTCEVMACDAIVDGALAIAEYCMGTLCVLKKLSIISRVCLFFPVL